MRKWLAGALVAGLGVLAVACGGSAGTGDKATDHVVIAYQPGIGYAELLIMKDQGWLEKDFPQTHFEWKVLSSGSAIRDGMISGSIQVGAGGVGPFLVGWAKGVPWKVLASINKMDLWLNAKDPSIKTQRDFKPGMKIALPAPDSIQAVVLRKAAEMELGNAHALDDSMVAMAHPDGRQSLMTGQIAAHLTAPPFQFQEVDQGAHTVFHSYSAFGESTFNSVFMTQSFYDQHGGFAQKFYDYLRKAADLIHNDPDQAAKIVATAEGKESQAAQYKAWMTHEGVTYDLTPVGFLAYARFMKQIGMIPKVPSSIKELELPPCQKLGGS